MEDYNSKYTGVQLDTLLNEITILNQNQYGIRLVGDDNNLVSTYLHLKAGHQYCLYIINPNWEYNGGYGHKFIVAHRSFTGDLVEDYKISSDELLLSECLINAVEAENDNRYSVSIRAEKGKEVFMYLQDLTNINKAIKKATKLAYISSTGNPYGETSITIPKLNMVSNGEVYNTVEVNSVFDLSIYATCALVIDDNNNISVKPIIDVGNEIILMIRLNGSVNKYMYGALYNDYNEWHINSVKVAQGKVNVTDKNGVTVAMNAYTDDNALYFKKTTYENYTLNEIFEDSNFLGLRGFDNNTYAPMTLNAGVVILDNEVYDTPGFSMKCVDMAQLKSKYALENYNTQVYSACRVRVDEYQQGQIGILRTGANVTLSRVTDGWETISSISAGTQTYFFLGTTGSPVMRAWVDSPVVVDMSIFSIPPTKEQMDIMYEQYLEAKRRGEKEQVIKLAASNEITFSNDECKVAFAEKMNEYASHFGMTNTHFCNASGVYEKEHYSCAKDIARLCMACTAYDQLLWFWGQETYNIEVKGPNARTISGKSTYKGKDMESVGKYYHIFGGKSGSWTLDGYKNMNLTLVVKSNEDDAWLVGCILKSSNQDRGIPFRELIDWLENYRKNPQMSAPSIQAEYASAWVVPPHNPMAYNDVDLEMVGKDSEVQFLPASTTKLMTSIILLNYCNLDEYMTVETSDITEGSGDTYYAGDILSVRDIFPALLLPSSNTLATMVSRVVGEKILKAKK